MPGPVSETRSDTRLASNACPAGIVSQSAARHLDAHLAAGGDAWTAFSARLKIARCSRSSSPSTLNGVALGDDARDPHASRRDRDARAARLAAPRAIIARSTGFVSRDAHAREVEKLREQTREPIGLAHARARASVLLIVGHGGHPRDLLDRAANRRQRIPDLVRERRAQLRDALEALGAKTQHVEPLLVRDVLKDRGRGAAGPPFVAARCTSS